MSQWTIVTLCQVLSNSTQHRCHLAENSNICRCFGDISISMSPTVVLNTSPNIMLSETVLIMFVLAIWLSAIGFCLNQYKSLRRLETQVHYCVNRKDPVNIGDIKIVAREQDSIIYKKKRYSTLIATHVNSEDLRAMHYVEQYLPKTASKTIPSTLSAIMISHDDLSSSLPLSATTGFHSSINIALTTHDEATEYHSNMSTQSSPYNGKLSSAPRPETTRHSTALIVPHISIPSSLHSPWNTSQMYENSCSAQHLCVPTEGIRSNRYSDGDISLPVPQMSPSNSVNPDEQLIDPRLIPATVRRSLLALHRESQENINMYKRKDQTQSENDVHGVLTPWKTKMKSKLKHTHPQLQQPSRPHANTLSILPTTLNKNEYERYVLENTEGHNEYPYSTPPTKRCTTGRAPSVRRSLRHYAKYSTQSTSESETTQGESPAMTSAYVPVLEETTAKTIVETTERSP